MILFAIQSLLSRNPYKQAACLLVVLLFCGAATAHIRVSFLAPDQPGKNPFWTQTIMVMQAAADNLDIDLDVVYSKSNTYSNRKDGLALLKNKEKPDYFLTGYWSGATNDLLQEAEKQGIKTFIFNSGINAKDRNKLGGPRDKYRSWIGQMTPDDEQAGFELAGWLAKKQRHPEVQTRKLI